MTDSRLGDHPSNGGAGATGAALLASIGREARTAVSDPSGRLPLSSLGGVSGTAAVAGGPAVAGLASGPGTPGQAPSDPNAVAALGPMLSSDEDDDEGLSSGAEERAEALIDMSHEPDGIFTFRFSFAFHLLARSSLSLRAVDIIITITIITILITVISCAIRLQTETKRLVPGATTVRNVSASFARRYDQLSAFVAAVRAGASTRRVPFDESSIRIG